MRVDAQVIYRTEGQGVERLWPILERNRFDGAILIQPEPAAEFTDQALAFADAHSFIKAVSVWVDLGSPELASRLDQLHAASPKFKGISHTYSVPAGLLKATKQGLPIDVLIHPHQFSELERVLASTDSNIIIGHLGMPKEFPEWRENVRKIARFPNASMKLAGLLTLNHPAPWNAAYLKPFVQHAIDCFGPDRLLFGSDWPDCLAGGSWKESLAAFTQSIGAHSIDFREKLLGGNAVRLYKVLT